jgi:hypothetical protein
MKRNIFRSFFCEQEMKIIKRFLFGLLFIGLVLSYGYADDEQKTLKEKNISIVQNVNSPITINGDPLRIVVYDDSTMGIYRNQGGVYIRQYYGITAKGSVIFLNGGDLNNRWGGGNSTFSMFDNDNNRFTPVIHHDLDSWTVETVYDAGSSGVRITQTVYYTNGNSYYKIVWKVANNGASTFNDLRFIHGGDTYFAGNDFSVGHWDNNMRMVYLTNPSPAITGIMGFYGGISSPASHYLETSYDDNRNWARSGNHLPDAVYSSYHDAGYALEWDRGTLGPGQTWTIEAYEKFTDAGYVQVYAPSEQSGSPGQTLTYQFVAENFQGVQDTFNLTAISSNGWTTNLPGGDTITIDSMTSESINVQVTIPPGSSNGDTDSLTLTVSSQTNPNVTNSDSVTSTVEILQVTISGNAGIAGAILSYNDGGEQTVTADNSGNYSFTVPYGWSGIVTPALTGYSFFPSNRTYSGVASNMPDQDYEATLNTYIISGTVTDGINPIQGVSITFSHDGHSETTDANGNYTYTVVYGTTTTVTPGKTGYSSWNPAEKTYTNIISNKSQNFTGSLNTYTISGKAMDGTNPVEGVTITFSHDGHTETTNANGHYSYTVVYGTTTTVTPGKTGYSSWHPAKKTFTNITADKYRNFTGGLSIYTISGTVTAGTNPVAEVTITFSHNGHSETSDADGNYSYTVPYGTSTTVSASKPGYLFTPSEYIITNLTGDKPEQDFTASNYVTVIITNPQNGETVSGAIIIDAEVSSLDANAAGQPVTHIEFYIDGVLVKQDTRPPYRHRWDTAFSSNGNHTVMAKAYHSSGPTHQHEITVNVNNSTDPPHIVLNRTRLNFGAVIGESQTGAQTFLVGNSGGRILNWTASGSDTWIKSAPLSGAGDMLINVSIDAAGLVTGSYTGTIEIADDNADNSPVSIDIYLEVIVKSQEQPLLGNMDSPRDSAAVCSVVPVTGWAIDDIEVSSVKIFRNPVEGHETGLMHIGDAIFVEGARTDVETQYSQYPKNYQAGWCYQMLTNFLPGNGNGTFVITAIATDSSGNEITLGSRTINCDNANAVKPFGAIDTPVHGGDAAGMSYVNYGWALTPQPNTIPTDGSTIKVWVDGVPLTGNPVYNRYREDIATDLPGYNNSDGAGGYYYLDTTLYANGVHTISWSVTDDAGNTDGIGSRYFRVMNVANDASDSSAVFGYIFGYGDNLPNPNAAVANTPVYLKKGYKTGVESEQLRETVYPDEEGIITIDIKENERIEIEVGAGYPGYLLVDGELRGLPVGSTMDMEKGVFYWQPGPGFIGEYQLVFVGRDGIGGMNLRKINITIRPKH